MKRLISQVGLVLCGVFCLAVLWPSARPAAPPPKKPSSARTSPSHAPAPQAQDVETLARKSGCFKCHGVDKHVIGPSFHDVAARHKNDAREFDLRLLSVDSARDLPEERKSTVIVARVGDDLHVRIFDAKGNKVRDLPEAKFAKGKALTDLKAKLNAERSLRGSSLPKDEKRQLIEWASSVAEYTPARARENLIETVKNGGKGNWSALSRGVPMPPFGGRLSDDQIERLVAWVLRGEGAVDSKVMRTGLGSGTVTSNPPGVDCGSDCAKAYPSGTSVTLTATPVEGSAFSHWEGDAKGTSNPITLTLRANASVRAVFETASAIPQLSDFTPAGVQTYLAANPTVNTAARFLAALPAEHKQNWLLMTRSESLQTGTAASPRIILPSADARFVFSVSLSESASYPGSHPSAIEYMQWDAAEKNFRFHEIVLADVPAMNPGAGGTPVFPARPRGISIDDNKCSRCHSTQNVLNRTSLPGTTGIPPGLLKAKNKPNWDSYDSWGGLLAFNRDRIYQGSVEAAAFRKIMNLWTWQTNDAVRAVIEQLELQPPGILPEHAITRDVGGVNDGHIRFGFDPPSPAPPVLVEPAPTGSEAPITTNYSFDGAPGTGTATSVVRGGAFVTLHHSSIPTSDEGRGVRLFDALGGLAGNLNQQRIADEVISHRFATGSVPIDVRPVALAIAKGLLRVNGNTVTSTPAHAIDLAFFDARNGMAIDALVADTRSRARILPRRKADIQKLNLSRTGDVYLRTGDTANGLVQQYGGATSAGLDISLLRLRGEVFRRPTTGFPQDSSVMGGIYVDRELYSSNTEPVALFRYFLEPLGVSVDKWSMGVRGRSRTYTFADVFDGYLNVLRPALKASLLATPVPGLTDPDNDNQLIAAVNATLSALPAADAVPTFTDVQRIFNKSCIECHGGLNYPPYSNYGSFLDLSEDETSGATSRFARSHARASAYVTSDPATSYLYQRITKTDEACPTGLMPCGGPALSKVNVETIRRWIVGGKPVTVGDPHVRTVDGVNYDFQAAGEFVFLRGENLEIQVRQTAVGTAGPLGPDAHTGLTSCVSVNGAVAVRVGKNRITYQPRHGDKPDPKGLQLRVDGKLRELTPKGIPLPQGGRIMPTIAPGGLQIEVPGGTVIVITPGWWEHYELWYLNIDTRCVRTTEGLMGTIAPGNWLPALPDGKLLGPRPASLDRRYKDLYETFGKAWRVTNATSLFDYAPNTSTKTFTIPDWPGMHSPNGCKPQAGPGGTGSKAPQEPLPKEVAEKLSAEITDPDQRANCVKDVLVTGEKGFAKTYLLADQIRRHKRPAPPVLVGPADNAADFERSPTITWKTSTDADGAPLTYRYYVWSADAVPNDNDAVVVGKTNAKEISRIVPELKPGKVYFWKVIAEDGKGGTVESETRRLEVK